MENNYLKHRYGKEGGILQNLLCQIKVLHKNINPHPKIETNQAAKKMHKKNLFRRRLTI